jgi:CoA:oxalate CoA-transferase
MQYMLRSFLHVDCIENLLYSVYMQKIFTGVKLLDLTKVFSGPFATRQFADLGAEVIKVEHTDSPDDSRQFPPLHNSWSGYFEILNRNKKGITLNLKNTTGREVFYRLCKNADVIVENLTPNTKYNLQIDYETIKAYNPLLIYASLSGQGQSTNTKYYDVIAQAESGLMSLSGTEKIPMKIGPSVVDAFSGMTLAFAIASALFYRERTQLGQYIDVSMLGCAMNLLESNLVGYSLTGENPKRTGNKDNLIAPFGVYRTEDGFITIAIGSNTLWQKFVPLLKAQKEFDDSLFDSNAKRLTHAMKLTQIIESLTLSETTTSILAKLKTISIPCAQVAEMSDVAQNELLFQIGALVRIMHPSLGACIIPGNSIRFSTQKHSFYVHAPKVGEHNGLYGISDK